MSIQGLMNPSAQTGGRCSTQARQRETAGASFREQLETRIIGPDIHLRMPSERTVFSGAHCGRNNTMQEIYAEYTEDSTEANPIVRISGTSDSGPYDFTCHISEIDPANASYAELAALYGHLVKTGTYQSVLPPAQQGVLPTGLDVGDVTEKRDFIHELQRFRNDRSVFGPCKDTHISELLAAYQGIPSGGARAKTDVQSALYEARLAMLEKMKAGKEKQEEEDAWDELMEYVDAWIDTLRDEADLERSARAYAAVKAREAEEKRPSAKRMKPVDLLLNALTESLG